MFDSESGTSSLKDTTQNTPVHKKLVPEQHTEIITTQNQNRDHSMAAWDSGVSALLLSVSNAEKLPSSNHVSPVRQHHELMEATVVLTQTNTGATSSAVCIHSENSVVGSHLNSVPAALNVASNGSETQTQHSSHIASTQDQSESESAHSKSQTQAPSQVVDGDAANGLQGQNSPLESAGWDAAYFASGFQMTVGAEQPLENVSELSDSESGQGEHGSSKEKSGQYGNFKYI